MNSAENKIKHIELIENVITRMSNNCFQLKGWTVTLVSAISAISTQGSERRFIFLSLIPLFSFWLLDSYYLQVERKYTVLYKDVQNRTEEKIDFSMDISAMSSRDIKKLSYIKCLFSRTELLFYGMIAIVLFSFIVIIFAFPVNSTVLQNCNCCP